MCFEDHLLTARHGLEEVSGNNNYMFDGLFANHQESFNKIKLWTVQIQERFIEYEVTGTEKKCSTLE